MSLNDGWWKLLTICITLNCCLFGQQASNPQQEINELRSQLAEQQRQIEKLQEAVRQQQSLIDRTAARLEGSPAPSSQPGQAPSEVARATAPLTPSPAPQSRPAVSRASGGESPLSFGIGGAQFTPLGFMDFFSITRSTNVGSGIGTTFNTIPFSNTVAGNNPETRFSAQNSRIGLRVDSEYKGFHILGYVESDFLGNAPSNLFVTSNSDTLRMRLYWADIKKNQFEFMAGQSWSLLTPNRRSTSPLPADLFITQDVDTNYQVGLVWARQTGARFTWNPNKNVSWAFAVEDPEQFIGSAVTLPAALKDTYTSQFSNGTATSTPNLAPDVMTKIAFDGRPRGHAAHLEIGAMMSSFRVYNQSLDRHFSTVGGGGLVNVNFEVAKNLRVFSNNYFSSGGGRYIFSLGPDLVVRPDGSIATIRSGSTVDGFEYSPTPKWALYGYYGAAYYGRGQYLDTDGKTLIGYGVDGGTLSANRTIQETTFGIQNNFWKNPQYGALTLAFQYSYVTRSPWSITDPTLPSNANMHMGYANIRYTLP